MTIVIITIGCLLGAKILRDLDLNEFVHQFHEGCITVPEHIYLRLEGLITCPLSSSHTIPFLEQFAVLSMVIFTWYKISLEGKGVGEVER